MYEILRALRAKIVAFVGNKCSLDDIAQIKNEVATLNK